MKTLCQDCLRVVEIPAEAYEQTGGEAMCRCGGDVCACGSCTATIDDLAAGTRDWKRIDLIRDPGPFDWCPEEGIRKGSA